MRYTKKSLEIQWAKYFEGIGIEYKYKEVRLEPMSKYIIIPSFYLANVGIRDGEHGIYFHIGNPSDDNKYHTKDEFLMEMAMKENGIKNMILTTESPLECRSLTENTIEKVYFEEEDTFGQDQPMTFYKCHDCGNVKIDYPVSSKKVCPKCNGKCDDMHVDFLKAIDLMTEELVKC